MLFKNKQIVSIKLLLTVGCTLLCSEPGDAREQWQINRQDPPPTAPLSTNRYSGQGDGNYQGQPGPQGQLPGFTGSGQGSGYGQPSFMGGQTGGGQPGSANGVPVPSFLGGRQPPATGGQPGAGLGGAPSTWNPTGGAPGLTGRPGLPPLPVQPGQGSVMPNFFKNIVGKRLNAGTILTGVSETNLSSIKSKRGDVFSIGLPHGLVTEGEEIVPVGSRILGVVVDAAPAKFQKSGMPGKLSISLKTLVFPDGRTSKINGFIDHNPAHDQLKEPKVKMGGFGLGDYGQSFKGMLYSSVSGIAWVHNKQMQGKEFILKIGDPVSVKLNTSIDLAKMENPTAPLMQNGLPPGAVPGVPGLVQSGVPSVPGLAPNSIPGAQGLPDAFGLRSSAPGTAQGGVPGLAQGGVPGLAPQAGGMPPPAGAPDFAAATGMRPSTPPSAVSGFNGLQNSPSLPPVNQGTFFPNNLQSPNQLPSGGISQEPAGFESDPNSIFKTPISSPQVSTPDPF